MSAVSTRTAELAFGSPKNTVHFQRFRLTPGKSVQLTCNRMRKKLDPQTRLRLERLHRLAKMQILGIRALESGPHPPHRPPTIDAALLREEIAQFVVYYRTIDPLAPKEHAIHAAEDLFNVNRAYVYRSLKMVDPARQIMKASAAAFATSVDFRRLR